MRPITQIHMSITRFNMALTIIKQMQEGSHRQTVPRWRVMGAERDAQSTLVFYLRSCHHIAISSFQSYLEQPETVLQPSLTQSLLLTWCYFISVSIFFFFHHSALPTLRPRPGNVTISIPGSPPAPAGHQSLRQSVGCPAVCQWADQSSSRLHSA